jgi:hypothetical protein
MSEQLLIAWTARLAFACYVARLYFDLKPSQNLVVQSRARISWTIGCLWFIVHVIVAFHFQHHWNHAEAYEYTVRRTFELTGWNSGVGIYVNEGFLILWVVDTIVWWLKPNWPCNRAAYWTVQSIFAFLMIQSTVVFGLTFWRLLVPVTIFGLLLFRFSGRAPGLRRRSPHLT